MTDLDRLKQSVEQLRRISKFVKDCPLLRIQPFKYAPKPPDVFQFNEAQWEFLTKTTPDGKLPRTIIDYGSNKQGKTARGVIRGICLAVGEHPFLPDDHPLRYTDKRIPVPNVGLVVGEQLQQSVDKKLVPEYLYWLGRSCAVETKKNPQGVIVKLTIKRDWHGNPCGSVVYFRSYDSKVESLEGVDQNWIHWDEPPPQAHYIAAERGLVSTNGVSFMTFTSLKELWVKDLTETSIDAGGRDPNVRVVEGGEIYRNAIENGGWLTNEAINDFVKKVRMMEPENYGPRILGQWAQSGSVIYGGFRDEYPYVTEPFTIPDDWPRVEGVDPHDAEPTRWVFAAISPYEVSILGEKMNRVFVVDYLNAPERASMREIKQLVMQRRLKLGYSTPYCIILDSKYGRRESTRVNPDDPATWQDKIEDLGLGYVELSHSNPGDVELGHKIVREYLRKQFFKLMEEEVPGLVFFDTCRGEDGPVEAMKRYRYQSSCNRPEEKYKCRVDPIRYILHWGPVYVEPGRRRGFEWRPSDRFTGM